MVYLTSYYAPLGSLLLILSESGNMQHANYTPKDIFWGELGGCLEALDAGTTTVVDHAHMNDSPAHCEFFIPY